MKVEQISVFLENKSGRLSEVTRILGEGGINLRALTLADTTDFGILRLIVNDNKRAVALLKDAGFTVGTTEVVAVEIPDRPRGLADILDVLGASGINVEYMYAFVERRGDAAVVVLKIDEPAKASEALKREGVSFLTAEDLRAL